MKPLDRVWLDGLAADAGTRRLVADIAERQAAVMARNELQRDERVISLALGPYRISLEAGSAFNALEVFQELFRDSVHTVVPGFELVDGAPAIIDLGANYGFFALLCRQRNPRCRIWCVEANPRVYPYLCRNLADNGLADVVAEHAAVAGRDGELEFDYIPELPAISGKGIRAVPRAWMKREFIKTSVVPCRTLGTLLGGWNAPYIDLVKIDVEGMEDEVLAGAAGCLQRIGRFNIEYHSEPLRRKITSFMEQHGFCLCRDVRPAGDSYYGDLYFMNRALPGAGAIRGVQR